MYKYKDWVIPLSILPAVFISVLINLISNRITETQIIIGAIIYSIVILIIHLTMLSRKIDKAVTRLLDREESRANREELIVSLADIKEIEGEIEKSEIWVLTSDLNWDLEGNFWKIVKESIEKRKNRYVYFIPQGMKKRYDTLLKNLNMNKKSQQFIEVFYLNNEDNVLVSHYVIYRPHEPKRRQAYMLSPRAEKGLAIILGTEKATELHYKLESVMGK